MTTSVMSGKKKKKKENKRTFSLLALATAYFSNSGRAF